MTPTQAEFWFAHARDLVRCKSNRTVLAEVCEQTNSLSGDSSVPQRLWHIISGTDIVPGCKTCSTPVSWDRRYKQYKTFCGNPRCVNTDPDIRAQKDRTWSPEKREAMLAKRMVTNLTKYGHQNYLASAAGQQHLAARRVPLTAGEYTRRKHVRQDTINSLHGVTNTSLLKHSQPTRDRLNDSDWLYDQHYSQKKSLTHIAKELGVSSGATTIGRYLKKSGLSTQTLPARSMGEKEISQLFDDLGIVHCTSDRTTISPYELDIFVPSCNVAIEYCGLYWHSEQKGKSRTYHKHKHNLCQQAGIQLLTIYEDEWVNKRTQVERKLLSVLGISREPVKYARACTVGVVASEDRANFFDLHHIQGDATTSVCYGLWCAGELVAAQSWKRQGTEWLLTRYATSCRVPGGFSKLLAHFKRNREWNVLVSFADLRWSTGAVYTTNGWIHESTIPPDYSYSPDGHTRIHKFNYRRKYLPQRIKTFDPSLSEWENCKANGVLRIWDCGKLRFVMRNKDVVSPPRPQR